MRGLFIILAAFTASIITSGQSRPLSICETLGWNVRSGQDVVVRTLIVGHYYHGFFLSDTLDDNPCPGWPSKFFTAPHYMMLSALSFAGVQLTPEQERANREFFMRLSMLSRAGEFHPFPVLVSGVLVKRWLPLIFRRSNGVCVGNGWGNNICAPAVVVAKAIYEDRSKE